MTKEEEILASDGFPARSAGPWVRDKRYYVERYLQIFSKGMANKWAGRLAYVDMFAGPGVNVIRNTHEEVPGSPIWALERDFAKYVFVDVAEVLRY